MSFVNLALPIWMNISPNIIRLIIIAECVKCISVIGSIHIMQVKGYVIQPEYLARSKTKIIT